MPAADGMEGWKGCFLRFGERGRGGRCPIVMHVAIRTLDYSPGREVEGTCKINPPVEVAVVDRVYSD